MSTNPITTRDLRRLKGTPQVWLTAYTTPMAQRLDPHCDALLVGDSLGMVLYGLPSTLAVTLDMMIAHGAAVMRGARRACIVVDLPFGSYQQSPQQAFCNAARVLAETGAAAVKLEGGVEMAETIAFLTARGVPVCRPCGVDAAIGERGPAASARPDARTTKRPRSPPTRMRWPMREHSPSCWKARWNRWRPPSRARLPFPQSASGRVRSATGRSW